MSDFPQRYPAESYVRDEPTMSYVEPQDHWIKQRFIGSLELLFGRRQIESIYQDLKAQPFDINEFFFNALKVANIQTNIDGFELTSIPKTGPLLFLANHPFGIVDGLILCDLALKARGNFQIMLHSLLCQDRDLMPYFLPVDFNPTKAAAKANILSKRSASQALSNDVPVLIFPSGMVSTANRFGFGSVKDGPWSTFAAKLVRESQATVIPVFFHGQNSRKFHVASHIAEPLRMALLVHEALNKFNSAVHLSIGKPVVWDEISHIGDRKSLTEHLYKTVQETGNR